MKRKSNEIELKVNNEILEICSKYSFIKKGTIEISRDHWNEIFGLRSRSRYEIRGEAIPESNIQIKLYLNNSKIPFVVDLNNLKINLDLCENLRSSLLLLNIKQKEMYNFFHDIILMLKQKEIFTEVNTPFLKAVIEYPQSNKLPKNIHNKDKKTKKTILQYT